MHSNILLSQKGNKKIYEVLLYMEHSKETKVIWDDGCSEPTKNPNIFILELQTFTVLNKVKFQDMDMLISSPVYSTSLFFF